MNRRVNRLVPRPVVSASALALLAAAALLAGAAAPAHATPGILNAFLARYPSTTLLTRTELAAGSRCFTCHQPPNTSSAGNCYKNALAARINAGRTSAQAIIDVELLDSDGDGVPNGVEITTPRADAPGQIGYNPGLIGATGTDPCAANTTNPVSNQRETPPPPPVCRADFNRDGALDPDDLADFIACYFTPPCAGADFNADGFADPDDLADFITAYFAGCP